MLKKILFILAITIIICSIPVVDASTELSQKDSDSEILMAGTYEGYHVVVIHLKRAEKICYIIDDMKYCISTDVLTPETRKHYGMD